MSSSGGGGLADRPTGPQLCAELSRIDARDADDERLPDLLSAQSRQLGYQQAQLWTVMAEMAVRDPSPGLPGGVRWTAEEIFESAVDEIRAELRMTRRAARNELANAVLVAGLPPVLAALRDGVIDRARALVFADACAPLTAEQSAVLVDRLLPDAAAVTATWLAEKAQRVAIALDPEWAERRYRQAVKDQRVVGYLNPDGTAVVTGQNLPADEAAAACARVDALADAAKRAGAAAKIDQLRATLFLGLLSGRFHGMTQHAITGELLQQFPKRSTERDTEATPDGAVPDDAANDRTIPEDPPAARTAAAHPPAPPVAPPDATPDAGDAPDQCFSDEASTPLGGVHLRVRLGTLLGLDDQPGEIAGWGMVPASVARAIAEQQRRCEWRFAILDQDGRLLFDGITRRRPRGTGTTTGKATRLPGAIVELHVPATLLGDETLAARYPDAADLLDDLTAQYARQDPIDQDPHARFPGRPLRRRIQTRFQRCLFPGCRCPAADCEQDHRHEHVRGGRTDEANMGPGCAHDHELKTSRGWRLIRLNETTFVWISPLGRRHVVEIEPVAPPLPAPIPRAHRAEREVHGTDNPPDHEPPILQPVDRRGRAMPSTATAGTAAAAQYGLDPPPY